MSQNLKTALRYAELGLHIFPLMPGSKRPFPGTRGCNDGTTDAETINRWWQRSPDANIGLLCGQKSNLIVLDYDCKHDKAGLETFELLRQRFDIDTLTAETPSGGLHQFFRYVPGLKNRVDSLPGLPGLDIRTDGGYVVLALSMVEGKPYRWSNVVAPAQMPHGLIELIKPKPMPVRPTAPRWIPNRLRLIERARKYVDAVPGAIQGQSGDVTTFRLACTLVRGFGLTDAEALSLLYCWNYRCRPPWSESELIRKVYSARKNGKEDIGCRLEYVR
jgi:hypothetical protein